MIKFNERFSFEREPLCWVLYERKKGKARTTKEDIITTKETYHASLEQVCRSIIDKTAGDARDAVELRKLIRSVAGELEALIKGLVEPVKVEPKVKSGRRKKDDKGGSDERSAAA